MLKFFRRIRRKLIGEGNLKRYLFFAVGEILLVMVGILLALQVNNWNEARKEKQEKIKILNNLVTSLKADVANFDFHIPKFKKAKSSMVILINHIEGDLSYHDSLKYHFGNITQIWGPKIDIEVYENIDMNKISRNKLQKSIIHYYGFSNQFHNLISRYSNTIESSIENVYNTRFKSYMDGNYDVIRDYSFSSAKSMRDVKKFQLEMVPHDFEKLKNDKEFLYHVKGLKNKNFWYVERVLIEAKTTALNLIQSIEEELKK